MKRVLGNKLYRRKTIEKIDNKIRLLGLDMKLDAITFLNLRLVWMIIIFIIVSLIFKNGYIWALISAILSYFIIEYFMLDYRIKKRAKKLEKEALFFLEIFALTLEGGRNLKQALVLTTENVDSEISNEFKKTLAEVRLGKSLNEALEAMKKRIPSDTINNTILNMIQSNTFGNSIIDSIYNQIDYLREKQILDLRAEIAKLPTKVSIISVIFFVPIMLLVILAPVLIQYLTK